MLPKQNRLKKATFKKVLKRGKRIHSPYFVIVYLDCREINKPQVGIIASTKVGKATKRNRIKRQIGEIIRIELARIPPSAQIIVICKPPITSLPYKQLQEQLLAALKKAKLH